MHVPAGAAEGRFQFLDDLAVAAHRAVQALQVAVDDEDQVVELLARSERQSAQRFGLVRFAVAEERPDLARRLGDDAAILEVAHEARLIDGVDRTQAHRDGGELPEVRHQPGMRIGGQARVVAQFVAEVLQVLFGQAAFEESAGVDARARRGPGSRRSRRADRRSCRGRNGCARLRRAWPARRRWRCGRRCRYRICWRGPPWPSRSSGSGF